MNSFVLYINDVAAIFEADGIVVPASFDVSALIGVSVEVLTTNNEELDAARVCELVKDGVVVARARLP